MMRFSVSERVDLAAVTLKKRIRCERLTEPSFNYHILSQEEPVFNDSIYVSPRHRYCENCKDRPQTVNTISCRKFWVVIAGMSSPFLDLSTVGKRAVTSIPGTRHERIVFDPVVKSGHIVPPT